MNTPVTPPTAVTQWTAADVAKAKAAGRHDLISQAFDSGQLDNVIADPGDLGQKANPGQSNKSNPMTLADAEAYLAAQETQA